MSALSFQAPTADLELTVSLGFSPEFLLGVSFFDGDASAGAGMFLDLPTISSDLSTVRHVDANCENATWSTAKEDIFDILTHIDASIGIDLGVIAQAELSFGGSDKLNDVGKHTILSKSIALPTSCIGFDDKAKTYGVPPATGTEIQGASASASATGSDHKSAASNSLSPAWEVGKMIIALAFTTIVFVLF